MIRRILITLLSIAALATAGLWVLSYCPVAVPLEKTLDGSDEVYELWISGSKYISPSWTQDHKLQVRSLHFCLPEGRRVFTKIARGRLSVALLRPDASADIIPNGLSQIGPASVDGFTFTGTSGPYVQLGSNSGLHQLGYLTRTSAPGERVETVDVAIWFLCALLAAYPVLSLVLGPIRSRRRFVQGLCGSCGYDLTGTAEWRCPECGKRFDGGRRAVAMARYRRRMARAADWPAVYRASHLRRSVAWLSLAMAVVFLLLWPLSYVRPSVRTPYVNCRIAWGCLAFFVLEEKQRAGAPVLDFDLDGYVSMETWWWVWPVPWTNMRALVIPLWMAALAAYCVRRWAYRPGWHRYARQVAG